MIGLVGTTIGDYIRTKRELRGWSQARLGAAAETSGAYISQIESGKVALPNADLRRRLANALEVSHLDLLVAAGEISEAEVGQAGVVGIVEPDPDRARLIEKLRRLRLTRERIYALERAIDGYVEFDIMTGQSVQEGIGGNDTDVEDR